MSQGVLPSGKGGMRRRSAIGTAGLVLPRQLFRVVGDADRVGGEGGAVEIAVQLGDGGEIVDLQLDPVVVRGRDSTSTS